MNTCLFLLFPRSVLFVLGIPLFRGELIVIVWAHRGGGSVAEGLCT